MAHEWVLADRMFQSQLDESFVAHQYVIAAQAQSSVNLPYGPWGCERRPERRRVHDHAAAHDRRPCRRRASTTRRSATNSMRPACRGAFTPASTARRRAASARSGRAIRPCSHIYDGPDWAKTSSRRKSVSSPTSPPASSRTSRGSRRVCDDSDHANCGGGYGPSWVAALVNAVGKSKFWNSTAIFVQWDDWGGLYDHVPPPYRGLRRTWLPRAAARHLAVRQAELRFARAVRNGQRAAVCRGSLRLAASSPRPTRARRRRPPTASIFRARRARSSPIKAPKDAAVLPAPRQPTSAFPTKNKERGGRVRARLLLRSYERAA